MDLIKESFVVVIRSAPDKANGEHWQLDLRRFDEDDTQEDGRNTYYFLNGNPLAEKNEAAHHPQDDSKFTDGRNVADRGGGECKKDHQIRPDGSSANNQPIQAIRFDQVQKLAPVTVQDVKTQNKRCYRPCDPNVYDRMETTYPNLVDQWIGNDR